MKKRDEAILNEENVVDNQNEQPIVEVDIVAVSPNSPI